MRKTFLTRKSSRKFSENFHCVCCMCSIWTDLFLGEVAAIVFCLSRLSDIAKSFKLCIHITNTLLSLTSSHFYLNLFFVCLTYLLHAFEKKNRSKFIDSTVSYNSTQHSNTLWMWVYWSSIWKKKYLSCTVNSFVSTYNNMLGHSKHTRAAYISREKKNHKIYFMKWKQGKRV